MEFRLTKETLKRLSEKQEVTVRDIMGFFVSDLCRDLERENAELTRLKLGDGDEEEAVLFLCNLSRKIAKIYSRNKELFDSPQYQSVWEGAQKKLSEATQRLEAIEGEIAVAGKLLEEKKRVLSEREEAYAQVAERLKQEEEKLKGWKADVENTEERLTFVEGEIAGSRERKRELEASLERSRQLCEKKKEEYAWICGEQKLVDKELEKLEEEYREPLVRVGKRQNELKNAFGRLESDGILCGEWIFDRKAAEALRKDLEANMQQAEEHIERCRKEYEKLLIYVENGGE